MGINMTRKVKATFSAKRKLEYPKLMVEGGYGNTQVEKNTVQVNLLYRDGSNNILLNAFIAKN